MTGIFNPAIFNPPWMAGQLFGQPVGQTLNIVVADGLGPGGATAFINGVGVSVGATRLELFAATADDTAFDALEATALKIVEVLPHTPFGALGINFGFHDTEPPAQIEPLFVSKEKLEEKFTVNERTMSAQLAAENGTLLNIERTLNDEGFFLAINHHFPDLNAINAADLIAGKLKQERDQAIQLCKDLYGYDEVGTETFPFPET
jgi:hypothetical protein